MVSRMGADSATPVTDLVDGSHHKSPRPYQTTPDRASFNMADQVFAVVELLENILLCLEFKTLLLSQRVSCTWRDTIASSSKLQKKLFLKAAKFEEAKALGMVTEKSLVITEIGEAICEAERILNTHIITFVGDLLHDDPEDEQTYDCRLQLSKDTLPYTISALRGQSSWERMFISQPPPVAFPLEAFWGEQVMQPHGRTYWKTSGMSTEFFMDYLGREEEPLREIMDEAELTLVRRNGHTVRWSDTIFRLDGWVTHYGRWEERRAEARKKLESMEQDEMTSDNEHCESTTPVEVR